MLPNNLLHYATNKRSPDRIIKKLIKSQNMLRNVKNFLTCQKIRANFVHKICEFC